MCKCSGCHHRLCLAWFYGKTQIVGYCIALHCIALYPLVQMQKRRKARWSIPNSRSLQVVMKATNTSSGEGGVLNGTRVVKAVVEFFLYWKIPRCKCNPSAMWSLSVHIKICRFGAL